MKSGNGKNIKKAFTYFIGIYFVISGVLISGGNVLAAEIGKECTTSIDCGSSLLKCDYPSFLSAKKQCMEIWGSTVPVEDYTPVKQTTSANSLQFTPQVSIPNTSISGTVSVGSQVGTKMVSTLLPTYIGAFYQYALTIVGIIATVILMGGGIVWLTSAGNDSKVTQAKEMIFSSLAGIFLLYGSYLILNTINPDLVKLKAIESPSIAKVTLDTVCCQTTTSAEMMLANECVKKGGARMTGYISENNKCIKQGCCLGENSSSTVINCTQSTKSNCGTGNNSSVSKVIWIEKSCSDDTRCKNVTFNDCEGKEDRTRCAVGGKEEGYCYFQVCYTGAGKIGEPCGNEGGKCNNQWTFLGGCSDPSNPDHDSGGRSCDTGLGCCKPE